MEAFGFAHLNTIEPFHGEETSGSQEETKGYLDTCIGIKYVDHNSRWCWRIATIRDNVRKRNIYQDGGRILGSQSESDKQSIFILLVINMLWWVSRICCCHQHAVHAILSCWHRERGCLLIAYLGYGDKMKKELPVQKLELQKEIWLIYRTYLLRKSRWNIRVHEFLGFGLETTNRLMQELER